MKYGFLRGPGTLEMDGGGGGGGGGVDTSTFHKFLSRMDDEREIELRFCNTKSN